MMTVNLTDIERDGLEEVFSVLNIEYQDDTIISKISTFFKKIFRNFL